MLDRERIKADADARTVVEYNRGSIRSVKRGQTLIIECPAHMSVLGRRDEKLGNCIVYPNGCYCMACHTHLNPVEMVKQSLGLSWDEAYRNVADAMGGSEFYESSVKKQKKKSSLFLTEEEATVIDICSIAKIPVAKGEPIAYDGLSVLAAANPDRYKSIVSERAKEMLKKYEMLNEQYGSPKGSKSHELYDLLGEEFDSKIFSQLQRELIQKIEICRSVVTRFAS